MNAIDLLLLHTAATWALAGLIWTVQLVQYPGFALVGDDAFQSFHEHHCARITWIVGPLMAIEAVTAVALLVATPTALPARTLWSWLALIALVWAMTAFVAVPLHARMPRRGEEVLRALVRSNWVRTAAWTVRALWTLLALRGVLAAS